MIARALMHEPQVLFLDEPTTGLDPAARLFVWDRLRELRDRGVTLVLTTHDMHEAATLADRVGIMDHGKLLALDTPRGADARRCPGSSTLELSVRPAPTASSPSALIEASGGSPASSGSSRSRRDRAAARRARCASGCTSPGEAPELVAPVATLLGRARAAALTGVELGSPALEDVFIHLTGRALR